MKIRYKHIERAFDYLGYQCPKEIKSESDLNLVIEDVKNLIDKLKLEIEEYQMNLESCHKHLEILQDVKLQANAEIYRDMNPTAKDVFYFG